MKNKIKNTLEFVLAILLPLGMLTIEIAWLKNSQTYWLTQIPLDIIFLLIIVLMSSMASFFKRSINERKFYLFTTAAFYIYFVGSLFRSYIGPILGFSERFLYYFQILYILSMVCAVVGFQYLLSSLKSRLRRKVAYKLRAASLIIGLALCAHIVPTLFTQGINIAPIVIMCVMIYIILSLIVVSFSLMHHNFYDQSLFFYLFIGLALLSMLLQCMVYIYALHNGDPRPALDQMTLIYYTLFCVFSLLAIAKKRQIELSNYEVYKDNIKKTVQDDFEITPRMNKKKSIHAYPV